MNKKRTIVYIDGSNLYYGLLRDSTDKWLDLMLFVKSLLRDDHEIAMIKYFVSRVIDKSSDHHRSARQDKYFDALRNRPCIEVVCLIPHRICSLVRNLCFQAGAGN